MNLKDDEDDDVTEVVDSRCDDNCSVCKHRFEDGEKITQIIIGHYGDIDVPSDEKGIHRGIAFELCEKCAPKFEPITH